MRSAGKTARMPLAIGFAKARFYELMKINDDFGRRILALGCIYFGRSLGSNLGNEEYPLNHSATLIPSSI